MQGKMPSEIKNKTKSKKKKCRNERLHGVKKQRCQGPQLERNLND
jgi:hypothetical protein